MIRLLARQHRHIIAAGVIGALASLAGLMHFGLHEEYTVASFVGSDNAEYREFEKFVATFGGSEITLIAVRGRDALDAQTTACLGAIIPKVQALAAVRHVSSVTMLPELGRSLLVQHPLIEGVLISHDRRTAAIVAHMNTTGEAGTLRKDTVRQLRDIVVGARSAFPPPETEIILTGPYVTMLEMFDLVREDLALFSVCVTILMAVALYAVIGSWRPSALAVGVGVCGVLCTLGLTMAAGINMSLITQMIVILVAVLAVANCVHLIVGFREAAAQDAGTKAAAPAIDQAKTTLRRLMAPCCGAMFTTVAGFSSVAISDLRPIRSFGFLIGFGLLLVTGFSFAMVFVLKRTDATIDPRECFHRWLGSWLAALGGWIVRRRVVVCLLFAAATVLLALPIPGLKFESDFVQNFRAGSPVRVGYEFTDQHLAPLGSIELLVRRTAGGSMINLHAIHACDRVTRAALANHPPIRKSLSIVDVLRLSESELPSTEFGLRLRFEAAVRLAGTLLEEDVISHLLTADRSLLRISLRTAEGIDVHEKLRIAEQVRLSAEQEFGPGYEVQVTGLYYFYAKLIAGLLRDQNLSFGISVAAVFLMMVVFMRSWKMAAIGLLVNLFPMVACVGLAGWLDVPINMATSMMLSVSMGIAVDHSIHYVCRYRRELAVDGDPRAAIMRTHGSVGQACVFNTIVITFGFWILCLSRFLPTAYFGGLIGLTLLFALAGGLVLLPAMIMLFAPRGRARS